MAAKLVEFLAAAQVDSNGDPLSGYLGVAYEAGTSTETAVWYDRAQTDPSAGGTTRFNLGTDGTIEVYANRLNDYKIFLSGADPTVESPVKTISGVDAELLENFSSDTPTTGKVATWDGMAREDARKSADLTTANDNALSNGKVLYAPSGGYDVDAKISYKTPIIGDGATPINPTKFVSGITDDTAILEVNSVDRWEMRDFFIDSSDGLTRQAFTGIKSLANSTRYILKNILVNHATKGFDLYGWIASMVNLWANDCGTGFKGEQINGCDINFNAESCDLGMQLDASDGTVISGTIEDNTVGMKIDSGSKNIRVDNYFETNGTDIILGETSGASNTVKGVVVTGKLNSTSGIGVTIDNADGVQITGQANVSSPVVVESGARNIKLDYIPAFTDTATNRAYTANPRDNSTTIRPVLNYFPNPNFTGGIRGMLTAAKVRSTFAEETTITRDGRSALKVTATAGQANSYTLATLPANIVALLIGKRIVVAGWLYIPDIAHYQGTDYLPNIILRATGGAGGTVSTPDAGTPTWQEGYWNLFLYELVVPSDATGFQIEFWANQNITTADGTEYVIFSDVIITDLCDVRKIMNGDYVNNDKAWRWDGLSLVTYGTAAPTDTTSIALIGDRQIKTDLTIDGNNMILREWVCTADGVVGSSAGTWTPQYVSSVTPAT